MEDRRAATDRRTQRDRRNRTRDAGRGATQLRRRAEVLLRQPPLFGAIGEVREAVLELRAETERALADADERLRTAARDRRDARHRLRACDRALIGTGEVVDPRTGGRRQYAFVDGGMTPDPVDQSGADVELSGVELRDALVELLVITGTPLSVKELHRLLVAHGVKVPGRPTQVISNALRVEVGRGRVERVGWGAYRATDPPPA